MTPDLLHADSADRYALDARWLRFRQADTEREFTRHHNQRAVPALRLAIGFLALVIAIPTLVEWYGFQVEGMSGYDAWEALLPGRIAGVGMLAIGYALTLYPPVVERGQRVVAAFVVLLAALMLAANPVYGPWISVAVPVFNFAIMLCMVASGLLFFIIAPLVSLITLAWLGILLAWTDNAFAPGFITLATLLTMLSIVYSRERAERLAWASGLQLASEKRRSEALLLNVLPVSIADRMRTGERLIADRHEEVAVVFADIVDFTPLSASLPPEDLVRILDDVFTRFDRIAARLDLEKIKTIGDAYMVAAGLPTERRREPARALEAALAMREAIHTVNRERGIALDIRVGAHIGSVVAGVIGESKFVYDLWGDVVNVASRMESTAPRGEIQVTDALAEATREQFMFEARGDIEVKGKGRMHTWLLRGARSANDGIP